MIDTLDLKRRIALVQIARAGAWENAWRIPVSGKLADLEARLDAFGRDASVALELFPDAYEFLGFRFGDVAAATRAALLRDLVDAALAGGTLGDAIARLPAGAWFGAAPERFELGVLNAWRTNPTLAIPRVRFEENEAGVVQSVRAYCAANPELLPRITLECAYSRPHEHWHGRVLARDAESGADQVVTACMTHMRAAL